MPEVPPPRPLHHTDWGFINPPGSPVRDHGIADFVPFFARRIAARPVVDVPEGHILPEAEAIGAMTRAHADGRTAITWIGHSTFLVRIAGLTILTDPYVTDWATPIPGLGPKRYAPPGIAIERLPPIDLVIVSHNHYDHLDAKTLERLPGKDRVQIVVPLGVGEIFAKRGFANIRELDWGDTTALGPLTITALPAIHWSRRTAADENRTLWASFKIEGAGRKLFFPGDTGYGPVFAKIGQEHGPFDLLFAPIGSYEPKVIMHASHTTPEQAVQLGRDIGAKRLVAIHWGTVVLTDEPQFEPPERFRPAARAAGYKDDEAWVLKIGETRILD
jgi:L-ascorbate metabolism protein UlaG (beta-lactamase superfamily)